MNKLEKQINIRFERVSGTNKQITTLYTLLKTRIHFISHTKLPSYSQHEKFVKKNPYRDWYIIYQNISALGAFYIKKDNSIGLNLDYNSLNITKSVLDFIKKNFTPNKGIISEIPPYFFVNVPSSNTELQRFLKNLKINSIQISYKV